MIALPTPYSGLERQVVGFPSMSPCAFKLERRCLILIRLRETFSSVVFREGNYVFQGNSDSSASGAPAFMINDIGGESLPFMPFGAAEAQVV